MYKILVVEDDEAIGKFLEELLTENAYTVKLESHGIRAIKQMEKIRPDLLLLDLGLPELGGETVCKEAKKMYPDLPVIILTARQGTSNVVKGLHLGADDYIPKPFEADELIARIEAALRAYNLQEAILKVDDLELNNKTMEVRRGEKKISLTAQEFRLLEYLLLNKGRVLSRDNILNRIWNNWADVETRVVDVYIGYLRRKIDNGHTKKLIQSVRGFGYTIKDPE